MIKLTTPDGKRIYVGRSVLLNSYMFRNPEAPETLIESLSGQVHAVKEPPEEIAALVGDVQL